MPKRSPQIKGIYNQIPYESDNELHCLYLLFELKEAGYIEKIERAQTFSLTEGFKNTYLERDKKGKEVQKSQIILRPSVYTPEFKVTWTNKGSIFHSSIDTNEKVTNSFISHKEKRKNITYIEAKSSGFDFNNMTRLFKSNQKFLFDKYGIYINLFQPEDWFKKYFTPEKYLKTKTGKPRKIKFEVKSLKNFIEEKHESNSRANSTN